MIRRLRPPARPLPTVDKDATWYWEPPDAAVRWEWCRVYHQDEYAADGAAFREFGPQARLDHQLDRQHTARFPSRALRMPSWPCPPQLTWRCLRAVQTKLFNYAPRASNFGRGRGVASADPPVLAESTEQRTRRVRALE
jgi:hypothetical protein